MRKLVFAALCGLVLLYASPALASQVPILQNLIGEGYGPDALGREVQVVVLVNDVRMGRNGNILLYGMTSSIHSDDLSMRIGANLVGVEFSEAKNFIGRAAIVRGRILAGPGLPLAEGLIREAIPEWLLLNGQVSWPE